MISNDDKFRSLLRHVVKPNGVVYTLGSNLIDFLYIVKKEGFRQWRNLMRIKAKDSQDNAFHEVNLKRLIHPFFC
jgi:hypothetical protein